MRIFLSPHSREFFVRSAVQEFAQSINSGRKIVADMTSLIEATDEIPLSHLEYWERYIRSEFYQTLNASERTSARLWDKPQMLTWLDLISWDGYTRERTLRTLNGAAPNRFFFALMVRRLNDWVPQVRAAAREKLPFIIEETELSYVVDVLAQALIDWHLWGRIEQEGKDLLLELISKPEIGRALKDKIISSSAGPMSTLLTQVGRTPVLDPFLNEIAEKAIQPSVRAKAYRSQFEGRIFWLKERKFDKRYFQNKRVAVTDERKIHVTTSFTALLKSASLDKSSIVRRVSAEFLISELGNVDEAKQMAERFAKDESFAVSERGTFALKKLEEMG